ncbi:cupin domain-containing protein [Arenimonas terrae]|uniref:Cupin domain-containing protein n=1 Tax=Arenimonas terrae TaxID=2546226 RepID=A0A5C4RTD9_9GAMM|nr:cupin domain-containing protein [Arenimonas terrae]TNJ34262.1 cupin domain-containing protein [Arenimonas terrae]
MTALTRIAPAGDIALAPAVAADRLLAGDPRQGVANAYSDASGQFHAGVWAAEPATWRVHYTEHEYCEILEGRIRMRHEDGTVEEVGPGDRFVVPAGWIGTWEVLERARKVYVIFEPALR